MTENEVALELVEWSRATLPELVAGVHYLSAGKTRLPDVSVDVAEKRIARDDERFPYRQLQQTTIRVFECEAVFVVESEAGPGAPAPEADKRETEQLRDFGARLEASILNDATLGERVQMASELITFDYRLPFVEYADGTRGRQMTLNMAVAELVPSRGGL
jgi:hypothetical protein